LNWLRKAEGFDARFRRPHWPENLFAGLQSGRLFDRVRNGSQQPTPETGYPFTTSRTSQVIGISGLKSCREFWEIPVEGNVGMDQDLDPDPDKPFSGDNILVKGVVRVWKAGRVCLMNGHGARHWRWCRR